MRQASKRIPESAEKTVRDIRRATRRHHSAEEKPRIVLEGLRGEDSIAELCRKEGINQNLYYRWSKEFLEAGKKRLAGDTAREATSDEVKELKAEARQLKETLAEVLIKTACSKKRSRGWGGRFMRDSASEKFEIIELVEQSSLSIRRTLAPIGIPRSTFYDWYSRYQEGGIEALEDGKPRPRRIWNKIPDKIETAIVNLALEEPDLSPRELAVNFTDTQGSFVSEATVYRLLKDHGLITSPAFILMKAADRFANPTTAPNQLWQTDFTYLKVIGWGWFYLSTVLDDFSRYILAWKLCTTMSATDVSDTLQVALRGSGLNQVKVLHRPRLLSDNGPSYVSNELGKWLEDNGIRHIRGRPYHPMTQGKIERYHRSMKNRILLDNYYLPGQLEQSIEEFHHESLDNLTPADVYFGRGQVILERRQKIKRKTIEQRRRLHQQAIAASTFNPDEPDIVLNCQTQLPETLRGHPGHSLVFLRSALDHTRPLTQFRLDDEAVAVLRHDVARISELCLLTLALLGEFSLGVRGRTVRLIAALLAVKMALAVAPRRWWVTRTVLRHKALHRCPSLNLRAVDGKVVVRKQGSHLPMSEKLGQEFARHLGFEQPVAVFREHRRHPNSIIHAKTDKPAIEQIVM